MKLVACVVANGRDELLKRSLRGILNQSMQMDTVLVVDNARQKSTKQICKKHAVKYIDGHSSLGGAGGFATGMKLALDEGADYIWLLDDDGFPTQNCLRVLFDRMSSDSLSIVCPLSVSDSNPERTSNAIWLGLKKTSDVDLLRSKVFINNLVQFFNGVLLTADTIRLVGFPNKELFLRGDEVDYYFRCRRTGLRMGMSTSASYFHQSSDIEYGMNRDKLLSANIPDEPMKRYYQFRNRGYVVRQHKLFFHFVYDLIRYPITFLFVRKIDLLGLTSWMKLYLQGLRRDLTPYEVTHN